jgi:hypothetical protein
MTPLCELDWEGDIWNWMWLPVLLRPPVLLLAVTAEGVWELVAGSEAWALSWL